MPLTDKGRKILRDMRREYGAEDGERVFYASANKGTIRGVHGRGQGAMWEGRKKAGSAAKVGMGQRSDYGPGYGQTKPIGIGQGDCDCKGKCSHKRVGRGQGSDGRKRAGSAARVGRGQGMPLPPAGGAPMMPPPPDPMGGPPATMAASGMTLPPPADPLAQLASRPMRKPSSQPKRRPAIPNAPGGKGKAKARPKGKTAAMKK